MLICSPDTRCCNAKNPWRDTTSIYPSVAFLYESDIVQTQNSLLSPATIARIEKKLPKTFVPLELETRPTVDTDAYAHYMHIAPQTARIHACKGTGPLHPIRIPGSAKLHWVTADIRRLLGVANGQQKGYSTLAILTCILAVALLAGLLLMAGPDLFAGVDWSAVVLGAGVIGKRDGSYVIPAPNLKDLKGAL